MDPQAPSQPKLDTVYDQPSNPAQSKQEHADSNSTSASIQRSDPTAERREQKDVDSGADNAMPSAMGYGVRDASKDAGDSVRRLCHCPLASCSSIDICSHSLPLQMGGPVSDLEGEQMRAAGDGDIASAQDTKHGFGEQQDLASDLDRKKAEQAEIKDARGSSGGGGGVDVKAAMGGGNKGFVGGNNEQVNSSGHGTGIQSSHVNV